MGIMDFWETGPAEADAICGNAQTRCIAEIRVELERIRAGNPEIIDAIIAAIGEEGDWDASTPNKVRTLEAQYTQVVG
jgi:hypothetical protein